MSPVAASRTANAGAELGHRRGAARVGALVEQPGGVVGQEARLLDENLEVGEAVLHSLEAADGAAELLALLGVGDAHVDGRAGGAEGVGGDGDFGAVEQRPPQRVGGLGLADSGLGAQLYVVEAQPRQGLAAHEWLRRGDETGRSRLGQEEGIVAVRAQHLGHQQDTVGAQVGGDVGDLPGEDVVPAHAPRFEPARPGLAGLQRPADGQHAGAARQIGEPRLLLGGAAVAGE